MVYSGLKNKENNTQRVFSDESFSNLLSVRVESMKDFSKFGHYYQYRLDFTDPRIRNAIVTTTKQQNEKCRDFLWGICTKGAQCRFRHELNVESMKGILKFCHDYQNRRGCRRPDCTYLHSTREEEELFLATGQIPRALAERHAAMSNVHRYRNMYVNDYNERAPPLPRLPPPRLPPPPLPGPLPPLLAAPPPPPPPPLPPTTTAAPVRMPPVFLAPPPFNIRTMFPVNRPPPPRFDASRPPPPLPTNATPTRNRAIKRAAGPFEARLSKVRKAECSKVVETVCENCIQREYRIKQYRKLTHKLQCEYEAKTYERLTAEERNGRLLLKSAVSPKLFRILEARMEGWIQQRQAQDQRR